MLGKTAFSSAIAQAVPPCRLTWPYGVRVLWVVLGARAPGHCCEPDLAVNRGGTVGKQRGR